MRADMTGGTACERLRAHLDEVVDLQWARALAEGAGPGGDCLDAESLAVLEAHAATCPTCQRALGAERHLRDVLRRCWCEEQSAPDSLRVTIVARTICAQ